MSDIIERIKQIIRYKEVSERQFCKEIGVANGFLSKVKDVGCSKLNKILYTYPEIDENWLLTGTGEMLKNAEEHTSDINNNDMEEAYKAAIRSMAKELKELERENAELRARLGVKEKETA